MATTSKGPKMNNIDEIQKQIDELLKQKNELIQQKKSEILTEVLKNIKTYGLTAEECGFQLTQAKPPKSAPVDKPKAEAKYRGPNNEEWAGGKGARPKWVKEIIEAGGNIEDYLINK
ncbi:MAG: H-NS histone family protein [Rickettsiales bacterium]|nr:H-NS histone family protein [Rickettsiales bacterium]